MQFGGDKNEKDLDQFFKQRGIKYEPETGRIEVPIKCKWVTNQNKCKLYHWRPHTCVVYECETLKSMVLDS
jgi:hypothetical protein